MDVPIFTYDVEKRISKIGVIGSKLRYAGDIIMDATAKESNKARDNRFCGLNGSGKSTFTD